MATISVRCRWICLVTELPRQLTGTEANPRSHTVGSNTNSFIQAELSQALVALFDLLVRTCTLL